MNKITIHKHYKISLHYFKKSGKYYSSGNFVTDAETMFGVFDEVKKW